MERREFVKVLGTGAGMMTLFGSDAFAQQSAADTTSQTLTQRIEKHNVTLRDGFSSDELADIIHVLDSYESLIGDLKRYNFSIGKERINAFKLKTESDRSSRLYNPSPLRGYAQRGGTEIETKTGEISESNPISIVPKNVLDAESKWERDNGVIPEGEERKPHGFRWTLAHELAHALSYKLGFGHEFRVLFFQPKNPSQLYTEWRKLEDYIREEAKPLEKISNGSWANKRPEGYPTRESYFDAVSGAFGERFASTVAYIITGADYADNDRFFVRRLNSVKSILDQVKTGKLPSVNQQSYVNFHILDQKN